MLTLVQHKSLPHPLYPEQFLQLSILTFSQQSGKVSRDALDADTKISHLIYFASVYVYSLMYCLDPAVLIGATDTHLSHLLFYFFLSFPSHSSLCKCHSSISPG